MQYLRTIKCIQFIVLNYIKESFIAWFIIVNYLYKYATKVIVFERIKV